MTIYILTLFPEMFESVFAHSILARSIKNKLVQIKLINIRDFGLGKHKIVDDKPYGGGKGMVMMAEPISKALSFIKPETYKILLSASGKKFNHKMARSLVKRKSIALICGHYEGIDARVEQDIDDIVSTGDFILTGGEISAMAIVDALTRLLPGAIKTASIKDESFSKISNLLEYPQYTRPKIFKGRKVPAVLLSGDHAKIAKWRQAQSTERTKRYRPDLIKRM